MVSAEHIRIVVVDDHQVVRDGLRVLLDSVDDFRVVGEANSGEDAVTLLETVDADVILMDIEMPGIGGTEATRRIVTRHPTANVLVLTMYAEPLVVMGAVRAGARGYLLKGAQQHDVQRSIRAVARGDLVFGHEVAPTVIDVMTNARASADPFPQLTPRERDVLTLLMHGLSNQAIGQRYGLSPRTVANHVSNILTKLPATDRTDAANQARQGGLHARDH